MARLTDEDLRLLSAWDQIVTEQVELAESVGCKAFVFSPSNDEAIHAMVHYAVGAGFAVNLVDQRAVHDFLSVVLIYGTRRQMIDWAMA